MSVNNMEKIISYVIPVAKEKIVVDDVDVSKPVTSIKLGDKFFHSDGCSMCGGGDVSEDNIFTQSEYDKIMSMTDEEFRAEGYQFGPEGFDTEPFHRLKEGLHEEKHTINGKEISVWIYTLVPTYVWQPHRKVKDHTIIRCSWTDVHNANQENQFVTCAIHPVTSITCVMPHMRFSQSPSGSVSLNIREFGRNFIINCPVQFQPPATVEAFEVNKKNRLDKLRHLERCADDFGISTYLPEIIDYIEEVEFNHYQERLQTSIISSVHKHSLFSISRPVVVSSGHKEG